MQMAITAFGMLIRIFTGLMILLRLSWISFVLILGRALISASLSPGVLQERFRGRPFLGSASDQFDRTRTHNALRDRLRFSP